MLPKDEAPVGLTDTPSIANALRQVADWLDEHPEITAQHAFVPVLASTREDLESLAAALGDRATERLNKFGSSCVEIEGRWDGPAKWRDVRVYGAVDVAKLMDDPPPEPKYRPILSDLDAVTGEGRR